MGGVACKSARRSAKVPVVSAYKFVAVHGEYFDKSTVVLQSPPITVVTYCAFAAEQKMAIRMANKNGFIMLLDFKSSSHHD